MRLYHFNSIKDESGTFKYQYQVHEDADMVFKVEKEHDLSRNHLEIHTSDGLRFKVHCSLEDCLSHVVKQPRRYKPVKLKTLTTPDGTQFLNEIRFTDQVYNEDTVFDVPVKHTQTHMYNIQIRLLSLIFAYVALMMLVVRQTIPKRSYVDNLAYKDTYQEAVVLSLMFLALWYMNASVFDNISASKIQFYPILMFFTLCMFAITLFFSEQLRMKINLKDRTIKIEPSFDSDLIQSIQDKEWMKEISPSNVRKNFNIMINDIHGNPLRRKFDERPDRLRDAEQKNNSGQSEQENQPNKNSSWASNRLKQITAKIPSKDTRLGELFNMQLDPDNSKSTVKPTDKNIVSMEQLCQDSINNDEISTEILELMREPRRSEKGQRF